MYSKKEQQTFTKGLAHVSTCAIRQNGRYISIFVRPVSKHGVKSTAAVAVRRKLLSMTFTIFKAKTSFDKEFLKEKVKNEVLTAQKN